MAKTKRIWFTVASCFTVIGAVVFAVAMTLNHWDFSKLNTGKHIINEYDISEEFKDIKIETDTADIIFLPSEDGKCRVVCEEDEKALHYVSAENGQLTISLKDNRKWYDHIFFDFSNYKITIYIPKGEYGKLSVKNSTGDINIPACFGFENVGVTVSTGDVYISASVSEKLEINVSTGDVIISDSECGSIVSDGSTGNIILKNVRASEKIEIKRSTGDVTLESSDASEIYVKTSTGDVKGRLLSEKVFITYTSTGSVHVPKTSEGGRCEIITSTGDIEFTE